MNKFKKVGFSQLKKWINNSRYPMYSYVLFGNGLIYLGW